MSTKEQYEVTFFEGVTITVMAYNHQDAERIALRKFHDDYYRHGRVVLVQRLVV